MASPPPESTTWDFKTLAATLTKDQKWQVKEELECAWVTGIPELKIDFRLMQCGVKEYNNFKQFPGQLLLRIDTIKRWNCTAASVAGQINSGNAGMVLSAPSGFGKSIEAYFFACLALECRWLVEYTGLASEWIRGCDPNKCAQRYLNMVLALNGDVLKQPLTHTKSFIVDGNRQNFTTSDDNPSTLYDVVKFGAENKEIAANAHVDVTDELGVWQHTPVLRIVDEHNVLWKNLGPDLTTWNSYFRMFTYFQTGARMMTMYLGSQHNVFEINITSAYQKFIEYVQPFSRKEFKAVMLLPSVPAVLREHGDEIAVTTNCVPRDVTLVVEIAKGSVDFAQVLTSYRYKRYSKMQEVLLSYRKEIEQSKPAATERDRFLKALRQTLLPSTAGEATREVVPASFMDRSLVYRGNDFVVRPINGFARVLLVSELFNVRNESLRHHDLTEMAFLASDYDNSVRGGMFEELHLRQLWKHAETPWCVTDEYGRRQANLSAKIDIAAQDFITLGPKEHLPPTACTIPTLYRGYPSYPRWDFIYADPARGVFVFFQTSVSSFRDHDKNEAEVAKSFVSNAKWGDHKNQIEGWIDRLTGNEGHSATCTPSTSGRVLSVKKPGGATTVNVRFVYVTTTSEKTHRQGMTPKYKSMSFAFLKNLPMPLKQIAEEAVKQRVEKGLAPSNATVAADDDDEADEADTSAAAPAAKRPRTG